MLKGYKFRLYPNDEQKIFFSKSFGSVRFIYNKMLAERNALYEKYKNNKEELKRHKPRTYTSYKHEYEWLKEVDNLALANAQTNLKRAYSNFFKHGSGYPKFKSKKLHEESYKTNNQGGNIRIERNKIKLPKIGWVKLKYHREFEGKIKSCKISKTKTDKYFISILVDENDMEVTPAKNKIGIDLGLMHFAITSNDDGISKKYENPKLLRKTEKKLMLRKQRGSKNREKARVMLAKKYEKIVNQRRDFLHKLSHKITSENQVIVIETLKSSNLIKNHKLSKSISDASWFEFTRQLEYKCDWLGRTLIKANQWYPSSQICSKCGVNNGKKTLDIREWKCTECGSVHDRDINASKNLLKLAN